ncbi:hypothetical protein GEMRC1_003205 [Eukaryota sp. GEM-RC1]
MKRVDAVLTRAHITAHLLDPENQSKLAGYSGERLVNYLRIMREYLSSVLSKEDYEKANTDFQNYMIQKAPYYDDPFIWEEAQKQPAYEWWKLHGTDSPLKTVASQLLGQISSASSAERNWPAFGFIMNKRRNRMSTKLLKSLVFVYCNLKLRKKLLVAREDFPQWMAEEIVEMYEEMEVEEEEEVEDVPVRQVQAEVNDDEDDDDMELFDPCFHQNLQVRDHND